MLRKIVEQHLLEFRSLLIVYLLYCPVFDVGAKLMVSDNVLFICFESPDDFRNNWKLPYSFRSIMICGTFQVLGKWFVLRWPIMNLQCV